MADTKPTSRPASRSATAATTAAATATVNHDSAYGSKGNSVKQDHVPSGRSSPHSIISNVFSTHASLRAGPPSWEPKTTVPKPGQSDRSSVHSKHSSEHELAQAFGDSNRIQSGSSHASQRTTPIAQMQLDARVSPSLKQSPVNLFDPHTMSSLDRPLAKPAAGPPISVPSIKTALVPQRANTVLPSATPSRDDGELALVKRVLCERESECVTLQRLLEDERKKNTTLGQEVSNLKAAKKPLAAPASPYDANTATKLIQYETLEKRYYELLSEKQGLELRLERVQEQVTRNASLLASATAQNSNGSESDAALRKRALELEGKVRELEKQMSEQKQPSTLERLLDDMRRDNRQLRDELERLKTPSVEVVQHQLRDLRRELDQLQDGNRQLIQENSALRDQMLKLQREQQQHTLPSPSAAPEASSVNRYYQRELTEARAQVGRLQAELQLTQRQLIEQRTGAIMPSAAPWSRTSKPTASVISSENIPDDQEDARSQSTLVITDSRPQRFSNNVPDAVSVSRNTPVLDLGESPLRNPTPANSVSVTLASQPQVQLPSGSQYATSVPSHTPAPAPQRTTVFSLRNSPIVADSQLTYNRRSASAERVASWNVTPPAQAHELELKLKLNLDTSENESRQRQSAAAPAASLANRTEGDGTETDLESNASISPSTRNFIRSVLSRITPVRANMPLNVSTAARPVISKPLTAAQAQLRGSSFNNAGSKFSASLQNVYSTPPPPPVAKASDDSSAGTPLRLKPFAPRSALDVRVGDSVKFLRHGGHVTRGKVLFIGKLDGRRDSYLGVELETEEEGKHDGMYEGKRYFKCRPNKGVFVAFSNVIMVV